MKAKELIAAAKSVQMAVKQPNDADIMDCSRLCSDEEMLALVGHVLATVRDDDDEAFSREWLMSVVEFQCAYELYEYVPLCGIKTRGEFRTLCRLLGVELKEPA